MTRLLAASGSIAFGVLLAPFGLAADQPAFVAEVSDDEWNAAIPIKDAKALVPKQVKGPKHVDTPQLPPGKYYAAVEFLIRADGTTGVYRIVETNNQRLALAVVKTIRRQRYRSPIRDSIPVAIQSEVRVDVAVERTVRIVS